LQDNIQVGAAAGFNDPGGTPWRTTAWSVGVEDNKCAALAGKTVTFDLQGAVFSENGAGEKSVGMEGPRGRDNVTGVNVPLTAAQKKEKKRR